MILEAKHISFRYGTDSRQILDDFSLKLTQEERVGLIAPSGFGKTTFCKILAGYEKPDEGEVLLDGRPLSVYKDYCPVQMIWQHPEQVVNPRLRMKDVLADGDHPKQRIVEGLVIEPDWMNRRSWPAASFKDSALQGLWESGRSLYWRMRSVLCWTLLRRARSGAFLSGR